MFGHGCMGMIQVPFISAQHRQTWSRLDTMYVMHNDSFLPTSLHMKALQDVRTLDHFPICLEVCNHVTWKASITL